MIFDEINHKEVICPVCGEKGKLCIYIKKGGGKYGRSEWEIYHPANEHSHGRTCYVPVKFRAQLAIGIIQEQTK